MDSALQIGPFALRWYGLIIAVGALAASQLAYIEARRRGENADHVLNILVFAIIAGIIGARTYHVIHQWDHYSRYPLEIVGVSQSAAGGFTGLAGLGIFGAIAGGALAIILYARHQHLNVGTWLDIAAPGLALAQAIGRWGNFINQELYGPPTDLPWGIYIAPEHRLPGWQSYERFHPLFAYESAWNLFTCAFLLFLGRRFGARLLPGDVTLGYLILYPLGRFALEPLRTDNWMVGQMATAQLVSLAAIAFAVIVLVARHRLRPQAKPQHG